MIPIPVLGKRWRVSDLFKRRQGAWFEPRQGYMWQENTGVTPTTSGGQTIGLLLDLSQGSALGPEKATSANAAAAWTAYGNNTVTDVSGAVVITYVGGTNAGFGAYIYTVGLGLSAGTFYVLSFEASINTGSATLYINDGIANILPPTITSQTYEIKSCIFRYNGPGIMQFNGNLSTGEVLSIRNVSIKQIAGNHASQATAANCPTLQYSGGLPLVRCDSNDFMTVSLSEINVRRNLLTYSEQFDNVIWVKTGGAAVTPNTVAAPDSSVTADTLSISPYTYIYQPVNLTSGITYTLSFYARTLSGNKQFRSMAYKAAMAILSDPKTASTNWTRFSFTFTSTLTNSVYIYPCFVDDFVSADIAIFGAQLELGSVATDYQKITDWTSEQYSSAGSVYFSTPQGMSCLHNQSIGTTYNLPALQTDIYGTVITPARLAPPLEQRLARYMNRLAGLSDADFFWQEDYGPELVTNGDFSNGTTGWSAGATATVAVESGELLITNLGSVVQGCGRSFVTVVGKTYRVSATCRRGSSNTIYIGIGTNVIRWDYLLLPSLATTNTTLTGVFTAADVTTFISAMQDGLAGDTGYFDNISVRELLDGQVGQLLADDNDTILLRA